MISGKVRHDLVLAASSNILQKLFSTLVLVLLARHLDKASMGILFFTITFSTLIAFCTDFGTSTYLNRSTAKNPEDALAELSRVISTRLILILVSCLVVWAVVVVLDSDMKWVVMLLLLAVILENFYYSFGAFFLGLRQVGFRFVSGLIGPLLLLALVAVSVSSQATLTDIAINYLIANATMVGVSLILVVLRFGPVRVAFNPDDAKQLLKLSFPFFILAFLALVHFKLDTLMLYFLDSAAAVASYEAGYKILEVSRMVVRPVSMVFFPICAAMVVKREFSKLKNLSRNLLFFSAAIGICGMVVILIGAEWMMSAIFGSAYAESAALLRILFVSGPAIYIVFICGFLTTALHLEMSAVRLTVGALLANFILNTIAIPLWGATGAAWTTVLSESALAFTLVVLVIRSINLSVSHADFSESSGMSPADATEIAVIPVKR